MKEHYEHDAHPSSPVSASSRRQWTAAATEPSAFLVTPLGFEATGGGGGAEDGSEPRRVLNNRAPALLATRMTGVTGAGSNDGTFSKNGARFYLYQTRASTGREHRRGSGVSMSLSGVSRALEGEGRWSESSSVSGGGEMDQERGDFIVGAEGVFSVEVGFDGEGDGDSVDVLGGGEWVEWGNVCTNEDICGEDQMSYVTKDGGGIENQKELTRDEKGEDEKRRASAATLGGGGGGVGGHVKLERTRGRGQADQATPALVQNEAGELSVVENDGLNSWVADFGLLVAGEQQIGAGAEERVSHGSNGAWGDAFTGWGFVDEQEAEDQVLRPSSDDVGRGKGARVGQGAVPVASSERRMEEAAATGEIRESGAGSVDGMAKLKPEEGHGHGVAEAVTAATDAARDAALRDENVTMNVDAKMKRGEDGVVASSAGQQSSANDPRRAGGFLDILRRFGSSGLRERRRDTEALAAVVRTTGGELYSLRDRLDELTTAIQRQPLISNGPGGEAVAAAEKAVVSTRSLLRRADDEMNSGVVEPVITPGHVRRVFEMATRRVRQAERVVEAEMISLEEAGEGGWLGRCLHCHLSIVA